MCDMDFNKEFFEKTMRKIKNIRRKRHIKQAVLANEIGMSFRNYNFMERGKIKLNYLALMKILSVLDISIKDVK